MHFSQSIIIAVAAFFASVSAIPTPDAAPSSNGKISSVVNQLHASGKIQWQTTPEGDRYGTASAADVTAAQQNISRLTTRNIPTDVGGFTNIGLIAQQTASYACEKSGGYGVSATIESQASLACQKLVALVPGVPQAESAWNIYQSVITPNSAGGDFSTIFRWYTNTASAPTLTSQICTTAVQELTSTFCQGKGNEDSQTRGGEIKIGDGLNYLMFGIDPGTTS